MRDFQAGLRHEWAGAAVAIFVRSEEFARKAILSLLHPDGTNQSTALLESFMRFGLGILFCLLANMTFSTAKAQSAIERDVQQVLADLAKRPMEQDKSHLFPPFDDFLAEKNLELIRAREANEFQKVREFDAAIFASLPAEARRLLPILIGMAENHAKQAKAEQGTLDVDDLAANRALNELLKAGVFFAAGISVRKSPEIYDKILLEGSRRGHPLSQSAVCSRIRMKYGPKGDLDGAWLYCKLAAEQGEPSAMYQLALMHLGGDGGAPVNRPLAIQILETVQKIGGPVGKTATAKLREISAVAAPAPTAQGPFRQDYPALSADAYQRLFDRQLKRKFYPVAVDAQCTENGMRFTSAFAPYEKGAFAFRSIHGLDAARAERLDKQMMAEGYRLAFRNTVACEGREQVQATWVKGVQKAEQPQTARQDFDQASRKVDSLNQENLRDAQKQRPILISEFKKSLLLAKKYKLKFEDIDKKWNITLLKFDSAIKDRRGADALKYNIELYDIHIILSDLIIKN